MMKRDKKIVWQTLWLFALSIGASGLNYLFQIVLGNMLPVAEYGRFNVINSFLSNALVIFTPLTTMACRITAEQQENIGRNRLIYKQILTIISMMAAVIVLLGMIFSPMEMKQYGIGNLQNWILILIIIAVSAYYTFNNSIVQGSGAFIFYGVMGMILMTSKLLFSIFFIWTGRGLQGVLIALLLSFGVTTAIMALYIQKKTKHNFKCEKMTEKVKKSVLIKLYGFTFLVQALYSLCINGGDVMLLGAIYDEVEIGQYSCAITLGKISLYITSTVATVLFPSIAAAKAENKDTERLYLKMLGVALAFGSIYYIGLQCFGGYIINILYGSQYIKSAEYLSASGMFIIFIGMISITNSYYLGVNKLEKYLLYLLIPMALVVLTVSWLKPSIEKAIILIGIGGMMTIFFSIVDVLRIEYGKKRK